MRRRIVAGAVQPARGRLVERVDQEGRFAAAGDTGDAGERAQRHVDIDVFELLPRAPFTEIWRFLLILRRSVGSGIIFAPDRYCPVSEAGLAMISAGRSLGDDGAAMNPGAGADIDDVIGRQHGILVMFDDDDRVAQIPQVLERFQQPGIVALMQADGGLIQNVKNAGQAGADLRGETDALAFAARQVPELRDRVRYSRPTSFRNFSRSRISFRIRPGDLVLLVVQFFGSASNQSRASRIESSVMWPICACRRS
jgi:hypothetical protein